MATSDLEDCDKLLGMKICSTCKTSPSRNQVRGGYCDECNRNYGRENYRKNKDRYFAKAKIWTAEHQAKIDALKDAPCTDCGVKYRPYVMEWDHRPGEVKVMAISEMRRLRLSLEKILAEVAKCDLVCSNCHRERTVARREDF